MAALDSSMSMHTPKLLARLYPQTLPPKTTLQIGVQGGLGFRA